MKRTLPNPFGVKVNNETPNTSSAWQGTWARPMVIDQDTEHPLTIARMTDHNVRGIDKKEVDPTPTKKAG